MKTTLKRISVYSIVLALITLMAGTVHAATYADGVFSDTGNAFRINVPANWNRQAMNNNDSNTHLFISPDQNVAVGVTTYPGGKNDLGQLLTQFQNAAFAGSNQLAEQQTSINDMNGTLRAYRVQNTDGPIIVGAFAVKGQGRSHVLWSMIPEGMYKSRANDADALLNTFVMTTSNPVQPEQKQTIATSPPKQSPPTVKAPASLPPVKKSSSPSVSPPQISVPSPVATQYRRVVNTPEFTFEVPSSYKGSVKGNQLILRSADTSRSGVSIVLQKMARTAGGQHETLEKSVERALSQLRSGPSANLLERKSITVDGEPGVWIELTYEGEDGTRKMAQILTADATMVYWLGLNGPLATFNRQVEDLNHAVKTATFTNKPASASAALSSPGSHSYQPIVFDDSLFEFSYPRAFVMFQKEEGQSQWADPAKVSGSRVVMVVQTMGRNFGNTVRSVYDGLVANVDSSAAAAMVSSGPVTVNGMSAYKLHFTLAQGTGKSHFKYLVVDIPGPNVAAVSFVGPASLLPEMDAHYAQLLRTVQATTGGSAVSVPSVATGFVEPKTSEEAFHAVQAAVRSADWAGFVRLLHTTTVETEMSRSFGVMAEENHVNVAGLPPREAMLKVFQQVPRAGENKAFLGKPARITNTRKEDADRVLVMAKFDSGGEQYLWMFRENGKWRWMYK